jgi:hypothetical protein
MYRENLKIHENAAEHDPVVSNNKAENKKDDATRGSFLKVLKVGLSTR